MANKYSVVVLKGDDPDCEEKKRIFLSSLDEARTVFSHHARMLAWSLQHKRNMGMGRFDHGSVLLWDHGCGYELEEAEF